ncbi:hypothetical protein LZ30DRAFT_793077 [Colletotrichum cereale]|nr:hypothetical protein LZ30DRAFT_793077 [Colletotrichum cereale]
MANASPVNRIRQQGKKSTRRGIHLNSHIGSLDHHDLPLELSPQGPSCIRPFRLAASYSSFCTETLVSLSVVKSRDLELIPWKPGDHELRTTDGRPLLLGFIRVNVRVLWLPADLGSCNFAVVGDGLPAMNGKEVLVGGNILKRLPSYLTKLFPWTRAAPSYSTLESSVSFDQARTANEGCDISHVTSALPQLETAEAFYDNAPELNIKDLTAIPPYAYDSNQLEFNGYTNSDYAPEYLVPMRYGYPANIEQHMASITNNMLSTTTTNEDHIFTRHQELYNSPEWTADWAQAIFQYDPRAPTASNASPGQQFQPQNGGRKFGMTYMTRTELNRAPTGGLSV